MIKKKINNIFIRTILLVGIVCAFIVFLIDIRNGFNDSISIITDIGIVFFLSIAFVISNYFKNDNAAVIFFIFTMNALMVFELFQSGGYYHTISILIIICAGYSASLLLKGKLRAGIHLFILGILVTVLLIQLNFPNKFKVLVAPDLLSIAVPCIFIYILISITAGLIKDKLDSARQDLLDVHNKLSEKNFSIQTQNEELSSQQEEMNNINSRLEEHVEERTHKLKEKNEALSKYAFKNAHNLRGPLARIMGLIMVNKFDDSISPEKLLEMIEKEANEIDRITREITIDLDMNSEEF